MRAALAASGSALALLLAACGGGGASTAAPPRTAAAAGAGTRARPAQARPAGGSARDPLTHLRALATIATRNGGSRAAGTPGGVATEDLIAARLRAAGFAVRFATVRFPFFDERRPPVVALPGARRLRPQRDVRTLAYSAGGDVRAPVQVVGAGRADAGCRDGDWTGFPRG